MNRKKKKQFIKETKYLGIKTSSSSVSLAMIACFFPLITLTGEGAGGGVVFIL